MTAQRGKRLKCLRGSMNVRRGKEIAMFREVQERAKWEADCNV